MASPEGNTLDSETLLGGGVAGVVAFLLGYLVTYAWTAPAVDDALRGVNAVAELVGAEAVPTWKAVGWLFLNAHVVATRVPAIGGGDRLVNFVGASDDGSLVLLYVLAPALLVLGGAAAAGFGHPDRLADAAARGATVVVGYLPAAVGLALLARHGFGGDVAVAPDLVTAVAIAGLVYPAFFGAAGGALRGWLGSALGQ